MSQPNDEDDQQDLEYYPMLVPETELDEVLADASRSRWMLTHLAKAGVRGYEPAWLLVFLRRAAPRPEPEPAAETPKPEGTEPCT